MFKQIYPTLRIVLLGLLCAIIISCSKISQKNYEKINTNMTMQEVVAILGEPTNSESINIAGISGTSAVWKDQSSEIDIQFLNDRVAVKSFSKPVDQSTSSVIPTDNNKRK
jgi:hypothetical protein